MNVFRGLLTLFTASLPVCVFALDPIPAKDIHLVNLGGADCPPCLDWRRFDLPKIKDSPSFIGVKFSHVEKTIKSSVPPAMFLPDDVKHLKSKLDSAIYPYAGSPYFVVFVREEVFDRFYGTRSADEIIAMLTAMRNGTAYPFRRCLTPSRSACLALGE